MHQGCHYVFSGTASIQGEREEDQDPHIHVQTPNEWTAEYFSMPFALERSNVA